MNVYDSQGWGGSGQGLPGRPSLCGALLVRGMNGALGLLLVGTIFGCQSTASVDQAASTQEATAELSSGERLYRQHCAVCHGINGKGNGYPGLIPPPADLTSPKITTQLTPQLLATVHEGRKNTAMGAWGRLVSEQEMEDIVAYVRRLAQVP